MKSLQSKKRCIPDSSAHLRAMFDDSFPPADETVFQWITNSARRMQPHAGIVAVTTALYEHLQHCGRRISKFDLAKNVVAAFDSSDPPPKK